MGRGDVGGDDQLRRPGWVTDRAGTATIGSTRGQGSHGRRCRSSSAPWRASAAEAGRLSGFRAGRVSDQPLHTGHAADAASGQGRARFRHPFVSVSLGLPAIFQFGGPKRRDPVRRFPVGHGDVVVWGGASRLAYHGIAELKPGEHALLGEQRINLMFRRAL